MATRIAPTKTWHKTIYPSLDPTRPELSAKGKTIVITGGGTGIGAEAAKYFAKAGASRVAILGRREQPLLDTKSAIEAEFPNVEIIAIAADITNNSEVQAAFEKVAAKSKIDVLCSNAAKLGAMGPIASLGADEWLDGIFVNLRGNFNVAKAFLAHCAKDGVIIETNSSAAHLDIAPGFSEYNVAKMATARFWQCLQFEHPELSVFSFQPGAVATDMNRQAGYKPDMDAADFTWEVSEEIKSLLGGYDDVSLPAGFILYLASPEARFLRGKYLWANWDVDELKAQAEKIEGTGYLSVGLQGWPFK
jgi:NAD(P)-dependent dehydrogenase (short-subunit alcohol dehydrogenase family)